MFQMIRRSVSLAALTAALVMAAATPSHAAHLRGSVPSSPVATTDLMTQAWSWLGGFLGISTTPAVAHHRSAGIQKDTTTIPFPPPPPPGSPGGSGSMQDPDGKTR